jgi:hypothetical protein
MVVFMVHKNAVNLSSRKHGMDDTPAVTNEVNNNRMIIKKFMNIKK